jgi:Dna[CI] antecedent, DciA
MTGEARAAVALGAAGAERLRQRLVAGLPEHLKSHVTAVIAKAGEVVVFADAAAWAARLKLVLSESPPDLGPEVATGVRLTVRVMPTGTLRR